jgi:transcriptional regulator with XRE-family HTH domain
VPSVRFLPLALKYARRDAGLSQAGLAARSGVSVAYVAMLETGKRSHPSLEIVERLAAALHVKVTDLAVLDAAAASD